MHRGAALACALIPLLACAEPRPAREAESEATRATMSDLVTTLRGLLPLALDAERFGDPAEAERIRDGLARLVADGAALEAHARTRDPGFGTLSHSFAEDARAARHRFEAGRLPAARFLVGQLFEDCVACHARLPSGSSQVGASLLAEVDPDALAPADRARLEVATRRFETALTSYERIFADAARPAARLDLDGLLIDYLTVALRVQDDPLRAERALAGVAARPDVPRYLARHLETWRGDLTRLARNPGVGTPLAQARALLEQANLRAAFPADRSVLVLDLAASGLLHRHADAHREPGPELAEVYWWLGVAESRIRRSFWISEAERYLETSIRMAPGAPFAPLAYALLEEQALADWGGSGGVELPPDVVERLEELHGLVERAGRD